MDNSTQRLTDAELERLCAQAFPRTKFSRAYLEYGRLVAAAAAPTQAEGQALPLFAVGAARRKWESLQAEGYRMQRIEFARSIDGQEKRGSIDPWGKVIWEAVSAPSAAPRELTPSAVAEVWQNMPGGAEGFRKEWGYFQFAQAVLARFSAPSAATRGQRDGGQG